MTDKFNEMAAINWYPGHMTKAVREMEQNIKLIDIVIELLDARVPFSSRNPVIDKLAANKYRLMLLNKSDLADATVTKKWEEYYKENGIRVIALDSRVSKNARGITPVVTEICKEKIERDRRKGLLKRPVKAMIVGIPNAGKSKFEDKRTGINLALIGSINDNIIEKHELSLYFIDYLKNNYCGIISKRYNIEEVMDAEDILHGIADVRKCVLKGGEPDLEKAAQLLIDDLRSGSLGRISLETP